MTGKRYIVTGGGGFVGSALVRELLSSGNEVISLARGDYPELRGLGAHTERVDLGSDRAKWSYLFQNIDGVFHTAAKVQLWGPYQEFFQANVVGTRNVIESCREHHVKALVFTSSPSVIADGTNLRGIDEGYPYPPTYHAHYPATKAQAEKEVLRADSKSSIRTVSLRPHLIWGRNDTNLIPTVLEKAKAGRLIQVGDGSNKVDFTYIDDCVQAHLKAMTTLLENPDRVGGKAYFISQGDPFPLWKWVNEILIRHGVPPVTKAISFPVANAVAWIAESGAKVMEIFGVMREPFLSRMLVSEMATEHYFSIDRARNDFGYQPTYTIAQALDVAFGLPKPAAAA